jgi:hypothetical protein
MDFLKVKNNSMKIFLFVIPVILFSCNQKKSNTAVTLQDSSQPQQQLISMDADLITDTSFGPINKLTSYADLEKLFGKNNLLDTMDYGAEGLDSFIVTRIFSNSPKEIVVNWQEDKFHKKINMVECMQPNSPYSTSDSLQIGSTLEKLLAANGKPISFNGTGWDYGGQITSYNKGKFENSNIFFSLDAMEDATGVMGDQELNTGMAKVKANLKKLFISRISVLFQQR